MANEVGPTCKERTQAVEALLPVLSGLVEIAAELSVSDQVTAKAERLAKALRDAALVAETIAIISGRAR